MSTLTIKTHALVEKRHIITRDAEKYGYSYITYKWDSDSIWIDNVDGYSADSPARWCTTSHTAHNRIRNAAFIYRFWFDLEDNLKQEIAEKLPFVIE